MLNPNAKILTLMFFYMFMVYFVVGVFNNTADSWESNLPIGPDNKLADKLDRYQEDNGGFNPNITHEASGEQNWWEDIPIIGGLAQFFGTIGDFFGMVWDFFTFSVTSPNGMSFPWYIHLFFFLAVVPCWIYIIVLLTPFAIHVIEAIGNLIPFT